MENNIIYTSHFGIYALILKDSEILLIKKNRGAYKGLLDLPGGSLEAEETLDAAILREVLEETGCKVEAFEQLKSIVTFFHYEIDNTSHCLRHIAVIYKAKISGEIKLDGDGQDSDGCVWQDLNCLNYNLVAPSVKEALELLE